MANDFSRSLDEWDKLASWIVDNKLFSHNVRWLVQVPRLYNVYKSQKIVNTFDDIIKSIIPSLLNSTPCSNSHPPNNCHPLLFGKLLILDVFQPLFEVTKDPTSHPKLHIFLQRVIGFDSVDDESKVERRLYRKFPAPEQWDTEQNPPYSYYIYYLFANMTSLNAWRKKRNFNTFVLRPHCGEAGDTDHLAAAFLTSEGNTSQNFYREFPSCSSVHLYALFDAFVRVCLCALEFAARD